MGLAAQPLELLETQFGSIAELGAGPHDHAAKVAVENQLVVVGERQRSRAGTHHCRNTQGTGQNRTVGGGAAPGGQ